MKKICTLSVDLDPITAYYDIHGLGDAPPILKYTILRKALPRFEALFAEAGVPATFFVVGRELSQCPEGQDVLKRLAESGHEVANHTLTHPYDLGRLSEGEIEREIIQAHDTLSNILGDSHAPVGFRSPGYGINAKILTVLERHQ